jgi:hypothetical protein
MAQPVAEIWVDDARQQLLGRYGVDTGDAVGSSPKLRCQQVAKSPLDDAQNLFCAPS